MDIIFAGKAVRVILQLYPIMCNACVEM